jgi:hypothetical protein
VFVSVGYFIMKARRAKHSSATMAIASEPANTTVGTQAGESGAV